MLVLLLLLMLRVLPGEGATLSELFPIDRDAAGVVGTDVADDNRAVANDVADEINEVAPPGVGAVVVVDVDVAVWLWVVAWTPCPLCPLCAPCTLLILSIVIN